MNIISLLLNSFQKKFESEAKESIPKTYRFESFEELDNFLKKEKIDNKYTKLIYVTPEELILIKNLQILYKDKDINLLHEEIEDIVGCFPINFYTLAKLEDPLDHKRFGVLFSETNSSLMTMEEKL